MSIEKVEGGWAMWYIHPCNRFGFAIVTLDEPTQEEYKKFITRQRAYLEDKYESPDA